MKPVLPALAFAVILAGCGGPEEIRTNPPPPPPPPAAPMNGAPVTPLGDTSRTSLDWAGLYEGTLPCADCPGIRTRLTLQQDNTYQLQSQYLDRQPSPQTAQGRFTWLQDGVTIQLDAAGANQRYLVGENRLTMLYQDGSRPTGPMSQKYVLVRTSAAR